ncbi:MAG: hypothetical protein WEB09_08910 [Nitriliruptor sp.]
MDEPGATPRPDLRSLQLLWWAFAGTVVVLTSTVLLLADGASSVPAVLPVALILAVGAAGLVAVAAIDRGLRAHPPADDEAAVTELRSRLVIQMAVIDAPMLLGIALAVVLGPPWLVAVALLPTAVSLLVVRPTGDRLDRIDASWSAAGADVSLRRALRDPDPARPPTPRGST